MPMFDIEMGTIVDTNPQTPLSYVVSHLGIYDCSYKDGSLFQATKFMLMRDKQLIASEILSRLPHWCERPYQFVHNPMGKKPLVGMFQFLVQPTLARLGQIDFASTRVGPSYPSPPAASGSPVRREPAQTVLFLFLVDC